MSYTTELIVEKKYENTLQTDIFKKDDIVKVKTKDGNEYVGIIDEVLNYSILLDISGVFESRTMYIDINDVHNITITTYGSEFVFEDFTGTTLD